MIVDLNLIGKRALVVGGGNESSRKVEALLSQQCKIIVVAEKVEPSTKQYADEGKICLDLRKIENREIKCRIMSMDKNVLSEFDY